VEVVEKENDGGVEIPFYSQNQLNLMTLISHICLLKSLCDSI